MGKQGCGKDGLLHGPEKAPDEPVATVKNGKTGLFRAKTTHSQEWVCR
jgi:hypothetical protein